MTPILIAGIEVRRDAAGRFSLNDLHRAAGGEGRHQPSNWLRLDQTRALIAELDQSSEVRTAQSVNGGAAPGTYVARELVYAYAMWISPTFHVKVIRAYDALQAGTGQVDVATALNDPCTLRQLLLGYVDRVEQLQHEVDAARPDLEAFGELAKAGGSLCLREAAKACGVREHEFLRQLQAWGWIYRRGGAWYGYAQHQAAGHLVHKVYTQPQPNALDTDPPKIREQVRVTPKGLAAIARKLKAAPSTGTSAGTAAAVARAQLSAMFAEGRP